jgi:hypothetical protein
LNSTVISTSTKTKHLSWRSCCSNCRFHICSLTTTLPRSILPCESYICSFSIFPVPLAQDWWDLPRVSSSLICYHVSKLLNWKFHEIGKELWRSAWYSNSEHTTIVSLPKKECGLEQMVISTGHNAWPLITSSMAAGWPTWIDHHMGARKLDNKPKTWLPAVPSFSILLIPSS